MGLPKEVEGLLAVNKCLPAFRDKELTPGNKGCLRKDSKKPLGKGRVMNATEGEAKVTPLRWSEGAVVDGASVQEGIEEEEELTSLHEQFVR